MNRRLPPISRAAAFGLARLLAGLTRGPTRREAAAFSLELDDLYRMEAHWALTLTRLGTVHFPVEVLDRLATALDWRSYLQVLRQARPTTDAATIRIVEAPRAAPGSRTVAVSDAYYTTDPAPDVAFYPYTLHPWVYALGWHRRLVKLRRSVRRHRLFFAGVVNDGYADRFDFPILDRPTIFDCVADTFRADACIVTCRAELAQIRRTDRPILLIRFEGDITPSASNHFLSRPAYLRTLARSEFALCPPGVFMPHAHNLIEALAVGTIPVLNYPQFCHPPLIPDQICLAFTTPETLITTVRQTLTLPPTPLQTLRAATTHHYDSHLSPPGAAQTLASLFAQTNPPPRLIVNREFMAARLWSRAQVLSPATVKENEIC